MNEYKILVIYNGITQAIFVNASDIVQAVYATGTDVNSIIKMELVGTGNTVDFRTITEGD